MKKQYLLAMAFVGLGVVGAGCAGVPDEGDELGVEGDGTEVGERNQALCSSGAPYDPDWSNTSVPACGEFRISTSLDAKYADDCSSTYRFRTVLASTPGSEYAVGSAIYADVPPANQTECVNTAIGLAMYGQRSDNGAWVKIAEPPTQVGVWNSSNNACSIPSPTVFMDAQAPSPARYSAAQVNVLSYNWSQGLMKKVSARVDMGCY